jgi:dihydrofolate reductase
VGTLSVFNFLSLDGYFEGRSHDLAWHKAGHQESSLAGEMLAQGNMLLFGRKTYDLMIQYWPTPAAEKNDPVAARGMNTAEKIVFSKTLAAASWKNTRIVKGDIEKEVERLKQDPARNMTVLGSGSIVTQLARRGLVDEFQILLDPVALGAGTSILAGLEKPLPLKLVGTRTFESGSVLLSYRPA